jgi:putative heme-binding domain-containing protein
MATSTEPNEAGAGQVRLSARVFMGLSVAGLIVVNNPGDRETVFAALRPAAWHGCTFADVWSAFLLFGVGVSIAITVVARREAGAHRGPLLAAISGRALAVLALGLIVNGFPGFQPASMRFTGPLQRVAVCYAAAALLALVMKPRGLAAVAAALLLGYWWFTTHLRVPLFGIGNLSRAGNVVVLMDKRLLSQHLYMSNLDPEGPTASMSAVATTLMGVVCGEWLRSDRSDRVKVIGTLGAGVAGVLIGAAWSVWFPINRTLWTGSYVALTAGLACLVIAVVFELVNVLGRRRWAAPFAAPGAFPIAVLFLSELLAKILGLWTLGSAGAGPMDFVEVGSNDPSAFVRAEAIRRTVDRRGRDTLLGALGSNDPYLVQAALVGLKQSLSVAELLPIARDPDVSRRLGSLLVLRDSADPSARAPLAAFLADGNSSVRRAAIQWVGEQGLESYRQDVLKALKSESIDRSEFECCLAALSMLDDKRSHANRDINAALAEIGGQDYILRVVQDPKTPAVIRARALRALRPDHPKLTPALFDELLAAPGSGLRAEAIRILREARPAGYQDRLRRLAADPAEPVDVRAEAIAGVSSASAEEREMLVGIALDDPSPALRNQAIRSLRGTELTTDQRARLGRKSGLLDLLNPAGLPRDAAIDDPAAWMTTLDGPADPAEGERVFFHPKGPGCSRCHQLNGRGGKVGPDLSTVGQSMSREKLLTSIVKPSQEIAPQYIAWQVALRDGTTVIGIPALGPSESDQRYTDTNGKVVTVKPEDVEERRPSPTSLMPEKLVTTMTAQEFRDLVAYLRQPSAGEGRRAE